MKVTVQQIVSSAPALRSLGNENLSARVAFRLAGVLKQVEEQRQAYDQARIQTLENSICEKTEDGTRYLLEELPTEEQNRIHDEINNLLEEEVEINISPIPLSSLDGATLTAQQLVPLDWLIEDDSE